MESSYYESLPIYRAAMDLVVKLDQVVRGFSQAHRYVLGSQMRTQALNMLILVAEAMRPDERHAKVVKLCEEAEIMKLLCNVGKEVKAFSSFKQFMLVMEQVINLNRQSVGWQKKLKKQELEPWKKDGKRSI